MSKFAGSLRAALQNVPQEIYDLICRTVFTAPDEDTRNVTDSATTISMNLMHVSHATREQYAATFYNTAFEYNTTLEGIMDWLEALPKAHLDLIPKIIQSGHDFEFAVSLPGNSRAAFEGEKARAKLVTKLPLDSYLRFRIRERFGEAVADKVFRRGK